MVDAAVRHPQLISLGRERRIARFDSRPVGHDEVRLATGRLERQISVLAHRLNEFAVLEA